MPVVKFNKNFLKLHNQTSAQLIDVKMINLSEMSDDDFNELAKYNCKADDGLIIHNKNNL